jgi:hypothetical protein
MERANLAREMALFFYSLRYGSPMPHWFCVGEGELALERTLTGKDLPYVSRGRHATLPQNPAPFAEVVMSLEDKNRIAFVHHSLVYTALFRSGEKMYKDAFKEFLETYLRTGDWDAAVEQHLFSLDQDALRKAAFNLVQKRLKPTKK